MTLLEKKYLKTIINCHQCTGTLDGRGKVPRLSLGTPARARRNDIDGVLGELTVLDVDRILHGL